MPQLDKTGFTFQRVDPRPAVNFEPLEPTSPASNNTSDHENDEEEKMEVPSLTKVAKVKVSPCLMNLPSHETISLERAYNQLDAIFKELGNKRNLLGPELFNTFQILAKFNSTILGEELAAVWFAKLNKCDIVALFARVWDQFFETDHVEGFLESVSLTKARNEAAKKSDEESQKTVREITEKIGNPRLKIAVMARNNMRMMCRAYWNTVDGVAEAGLKLWENDLPRKLLNFLKTNPQYSAAALSSGNLERCYYAQTVISSMYNLLRHRPQDGAELRALGIVEILLPYSKASLKRLKCTASCAVAYTLNEDLGTELSESWSEVIDILLGFLIEGTERPNRRSIHGFAVEETLGAFNQMASHEFAQERLLLQNTISDSKPIRALNLLFNILKENKSDKELIQVTRLFWSLSFNGKSKGIFLEVLPQLVYELQKLVDHEQDRIKKAVEGILWNIRGHERPPSAPKKKKKTSSKEKEENKKMLEKAPKLADMLMISYNWAHKQIVLQLNHALKSSGYRTWIDVEQMSGSTLEAMAEAVEQSSLVICCISDSYKESPNCRAEAEYAFRLNKPIVPVRVQVKYKPDGWLGMLMGTKLYFNCYAVEDISSCSEKVLGEVNRILPSRANLEDRAGEHKSSLANAPILPPVKDGRGTPPKRSASFTKGPAKKSMKEASDWSESKVKEWLKSNKLEHLVPKMKGFDGPLLRRLHILYDSKPQIFMDMLRGCQISDSKDALKLISSLEALFN